MCSCFADILSSKYTDNFKDIKLDKDMAKNMNMNMYSMYMEIDMEHGMNMNTNMIIKTSM
jgi:hypothetical protein